MGAYSMDRQMSENQYLDEVYGDEEEIVDNSAKTGAARMAEYVKLYYAVRAEIAAEVEKMTTAEVLEFTTKHSPDWPRLTDAIDNAARRETIRRHPAKALALI